MSEKKDLNNKLAAQRIGWVAPRVLPYSMVMASTRLRTYDVIRYLRKKNINARLYNPFSRYNIVVFQKAFNKKFLFLAKKLKNKHIKIVFDINVNYIDKDELLVTEEQRKDIKEMLQIVDVVITPSFYLRDLYAKYNDNVHLIEEIIEERFFKVKKEHSDKDEVSLLFCGYAVKSEELYLIKDTFKYLYDKYKIKLILICEKDPHFNIIPYKFYKYSHKYLPQLLLKGDIKISPRDLSRKYNLGHSFTRIAYPMSVGLPVVASPIPSYKDSPAILCSERKEWEDRLNNLICNCELRKKLGESGRIFVKNNFSADIIIKKYENLFNTLMS